MTKTIAQKLIQIRKELDVKKTALLPKDKGGKAYWVEEDVTAEIAKHLDQHGLLVHAETVDHFHGTTEDPAGRYRPHAVIIVKFIIEDVATAEVREFGPFMAEGSDTGSDSASPKAYTQARKLLWKQLFMLSERGDDGDFDKSNANEVVVSSPTGIVELQQQVTAIGASDKAKQKKLTAAAEEMFRKSKKLASDHVVKFDDWWMNETILKALVAEFGK